MNQTITALSVLVATAALTGAAVAADSQKGETLAKRWCATCHVVATNQQRGTTQSPPLSAIANKPGFNETTLAYFLLTPHPRTPDRNLSRSGAADIAAYIKAQK